MKLVLFRLVVGVVAIAAYFSSLQAAEITHLWRSEPLAPATPLIRGSDGAFYALTLSFGTPASMVRIAESGEVTTVAEIKVSTLFEPQGLVLSEDGNFYGIARLDGVVTFFRITPTGSVTTIWTQASLGLTHIFEGGLTQGKDGNFYGFDPVGGGAEMGSVVKMTPDGQLSVVTAFSKPAIHGSNPLGVLLADAEGNLYGANARGGPNGGGVVFQLSPEGALSVVCAFAGEFYSSPRLLLKGADGSLYGTVDSKPDGTILFRITPDRKIKIFNFPGVSTLALAANGDIYASTWNYRNQEAAIVRVTPANIVTKVFSTSTVEWPGISWLAPLANGDVLGTTSQGGSADSGSIFRVSAGGQYTLLHSFAVKLGPRVVPSLTVGPGNSFYGITFSGGEFGKGTVFRLDNDGQIATVHTFSGSDGAFPRAPLLLAQNGDLYGTTERGGQADGGTIFRISGDQLIPVHSFDDSFGAGPWDGLVQGSDGTLYGTTSKGGQNGKGSVYSIPVGGAPRVVAYFPKEWNIEEARPMVCGPNGNLYGLADKTGGRPQTVAFRVSPSGELKVLHTLTEREGSDVVGLTSGPGNTLYGVCRDGGKNHAGTIFQLWADGKIQVIYDFAWEGVASYPAGRLTLGNDGNLYGAALGAFGKRTVVFKLTPAGEISRVDTIPSEPLPWAPRLNLTQGADGLLHGILNSGLAVRISGEETPNRPPVAVDDQFFFGRGKLTVAVSGNDEDEDGDPFTITAVTPAGGGAVNISRSGYAVTYRRGRNFSGTDTFSYEISSNNGETASATVTLQDWSLVQGSYSLELRSDSHETSGRLDMKISRSGAFTGKIRYKAEVTPIRGVFDSSGRGLVRVRKPTGFIFLDLQVISGSGSQAAPNVAGHMVSTSGTLNFAGGPVHSAGGLTGKYTVLLQQQDALAGGTSLQRGSGWGVMSVKENGSYIVKGKLPDGVAFSDGGWLSSESSAFLYFTGKPRFSAAGTMNFDDVADESDATASLQWLVRELEDKLFDRVVQARELKLIASRYIPPTKETLALSFTTQPPRATVSLSGSDFAENDPLEVTFSSSNVAAVSGSKVESAFRIERFGGADGVWSGRFLRSGEPQKTQVFQGVIFQKQNQAEALFVDGVQSGQVMLEPR